MGQVKNVFIKNLAKSLIEKYPERFTKNFEKNKEELDKLVKTESKKIRNMIAGYLVHVIRKRERLPAFEVPYRVQDKRRRGRRRRRRR